MYVISMTIMEKQGIEHGADLIGNDLRTTPLQLRAAIALSACRLALSIKKYSCTN